MDTTEELENPWRLERMEDSESHAVNIFSEGIYPKLEASSERVDFIEKIIISGLLALDNKKAQKESAANIEAKLTAKEFKWSKKKLELEDIVAVSHSDGACRFIVHSFPLSRSSWLACKRCRRQKDIYFLAPSAEDALKWVCAFESQRCFLNKVSQALPIRKRQSSRIGAQESPQDMSCRTSRVMLVIINPRSGRGRARKVYDSEVEPVLKLAGIKLNVVETNGPHHAQKLAGTVDLSTCVNGIICVGGDGIVNEVVNGLLSRDSVKQLREIPIGIIPAGSDNSLIWTIMGIHDPTSAALAIARGNLLPIDVFAVEWMKTGDVHMGLTVAYHGFMSDVLELSEKYQKKFGPLKYFFAGARKFFCLPSYECEVQYLPDVGQNNHDRVPKGEFVFNSEEQSPGDKVDLELGLRSTGIVALNHDSPVVMINNKGLADHEMFSSTVDATTEPSEYVRGLDSKSKRAPSMRSTGTQVESDDVVTVNNSVSGPTTPSPRPRTRSKSRIERGWSGVSSGNGSSWDYSMIGDCTGDVSSDVVSKSVSSKWGTKDGCVDTSGLNVDEVDNEKWVLRQGPFLAVIICNHRCKTVQCLKSQMLAPNAQHDDRKLDLLLVHKVGRFQLIRFLVLMQFGRHLSLPFVEHTKVHAVKLVPSSKHMRCGIDGELLELNGPISMTVLDEQCRLIGHCSK